MGTLGPKSNFFSIFKEFCPFPVSGHFNRSEDDSPVARDTKSVQKHGKGQNPFNMAGEGH